MNRKIIIKTGDFNKEVSSFLTEVGADMPIEWSIEALSHVRNAVIEAFGKMGVTLEIDERLQSPPPALRLRRNRLNRRAKQRKGL